MDNFSDVTRLSTDLNCAAYLLEISAVCPNPRSAKEAGRVVNTARKLLRKWLVICGTASLAALRP